MKNKRRSGRTLWSSPTGWLMGAGCWLLVAGCGEVEKQGVSLLPWPAEVEFNGKQIGFSSVEILAGDEVSSDCVDELECILSASGIEISSPAAFNIRMEKEPSLSEEAYGIEIDKHGVLISAGSASGYFYAAQTFRQLLQTGRKGGMLPECSISDRPKHAVRGFMIDVGRNYQPLKALKTIIDDMAKVKMNTFHWHLTDRPAWRIESKAFPQLNEASNMRPTRDPGMIYRYDDIRELMRYAESRHIRVIPEIDMPGHSDAFRVAMGFAMESDEGMKALEQILTEFFNEIPHELCPVIHLGSDEVRIPDPEGFIKRMVQVCRDHERQVMIWNPGLPADDQVIRQTWQRKHVEQRQYPEVDSWDSYINNLEPMTSVPMILFKPIGEGSPNRVVGGILCLWPDVNLDDHADAFRLNPVYPALLTYAWSCWTGGEAYSGTEYYTKIPAPESEAGAYLRNFERILFEVRERFFSDKPFPYLPQGDFVWRLTGPSGPDRGEGEQLAHGHTIVIRDRFKDGGYFPLIEPGDSVVASTEIWSNQRKEIPVWIGFETPLRANRVYGGMPAQGAWDAWGSNIRVNGEALAPPRWQHPGWKPSRLEGWGSAEDQEIPWRDEELYWTREPVMVPLKFGRNKIEVKLVYGNSYQNAMFTFAPLGKGHNPNIKIPEIRWEARPDSVQGDMGFQVLDAETTTLLEPDGQDPDIGTYNHHSHITYWKGRLIATWSNAPRDEDSPGQQVLLRWSRNGGRSWTPVEIAFPPLPSTLLQNGDTVGTVRSDGPTMNANGYAVVDDRLYLIAECLYMPGQKGLGRLAREFTPEGESGPIFWLYDDPEVSNTEGEYIYPMIKDGAFAELAQKINTILEHPRVFPNWDFTHYRTRPLAADGHVMCEPTYGWQLADGSWARLYRDLDRSKFNYASFSADGFNWSIPVRTNFPDAPSRSNAGQLKDGSTYVISNIRNTGNMNGRLYPRDPLVISLSDDGLTFDRVKVIRHGAPPRRFEGRHKDIGFEYPSSVVVGRQLWVMYSVNKEDIQISRIRVRDLENH